MRSEEARCAADALGIRAPILLGFPDAQLGNYLEDPTRLFRLTARVQESFSGSTPDAVIAWGPDGATGHPDHRLVSSVVTQLVRAGAPGATERLFYVWIPARGDGRDEPGPWGSASRSTGEVFQRASGFTTSGRRCGRSARWRATSTQYSDDIVRRVTEASRRVENGVLPLVPFLTTSAGTNLFQSP